MKKLLLCILTTSVFISINVFAGSNLPKREFRGAWIATVINLDWPSSPGLHPQTQRQELIRILDELQVVGINAVIFQVRSECDAMYASRLEPWSYWLTGNQGTPPNPFYDPLEFVIAEAHQRGMELHAWFNPYRSVREVGNYTNASNHVSVRHPDWIIQTGNTKILNPGLPMARSYITSVVMDVVNRYDVDGVHFDDYFYPYPPNQISNQDAATFSTYSRGFANIGDWRRDNVNLLIKMIHDSIQVVKPFVKFGISPFGIWKNGVPSGITGLDAYSTIYCDALAWLQQQSLDYLTPQLYWPFGGGQDYGKLMPWWASQMNGRHLYVGQAVYRIPSWPANEMPRQIRLNRSNPNTHGSIFFRALFFRENPRGFTDSLKIDLYRHLALSPTMNWKDLVPPNPPQNLSFKRIAGTGTAGLRWDIPNFAADGDTASRYVVYRFNQPAIPASALDDASNIIAIAGERLSRPQTPPPEAGAYYYVVTSLDRNANESVASEALLISPPSTPRLASPANGAIVETAQVILRWFYPDNASSYRLQVALDSTFTTKLLVNETGILDTFKIISGFEGQQKYYWRVQASNPSGAGSFSLSGNFTTGFPAVASLVSPANNIRDVTLQPTLVWRKTPGASAYRLQLAYNSLFDSLSTVLDVAGIIDTSYAVSRLEGNRFYFWRVRAENAFGASAWSAVWRFKTIDVTSVVEAPSAPSTFALYQNYPNPFNPVTTIVFDLPKAGVTQLVIYDGLGQEVLRLLNEPLAAGRHEVPFYVQDLPSGIYYYRLKFEGQVLTKRMTVLK
ncbi:MAG: family 10 glycosylhydrolase [candidate division KSB1 bacterium]|nr:family 10 glycosylhydrolase [candidate division KSB1 bacterium]MDZ7368252.1 family 10 glycosylhydrolase [candidate division KSB1 bacterium]MDZ7406766.1 family 10 glycosylhydrolase [candidate division KSB1 bacterium]